MFSCSLDWQIGCLISSAIYGVATTPNDFATYLLAILIVNGLLYLAFYVIMKVLLSRFAFFSMNLTFPILLGEWVQALSTVISGSFGVDKRLSWLVDGIQGNH